LKERTFTREICYNPHKTYIFHTFFGHGDPLFASASAANYSTDTLKSQWKGDAVLAHSSSTKGDSVASSFNTFKAMPEIGCGGLSGLLRRAQQFPYVGSLSSQCPRIAPSISGPFTFYLLP